MARVLILGATSAIAAEMAALLAERGDRLYVVGRTPDKLGALVQRLGDAVIGSAAIDLDRTDDNAAVVGAAIEALDGLDIAVVAHGLLGDQARTEHDYREAEQVFRTNLLSPVSLLVPLANYFEAQGRGDIAVLSSVAGERGRPRNYTYGAAKGALTVYLQGLRTRLGRRGVRVHTFKLGPVDTPMTVDHRKTLLFARADEVAATMVRSLDSNAGEVYVPWFWSPIMAIVRTLPEPLFRRLRALAD